METLIILVVALGLSMDCFSLAIINSALSGDIRPGVPLRAALVFSVAHFLLFFLGYWLSALLKNLFAGQEAWAAFVVFTVIGLKMIREAIRRKPEAKMVDINHIRVIMALALAASIDALLVGLALGIVGVSAPVASGIIAFSAFLFTFSGLVGGDRFGLEYARRTSIFGGVFLFIAALHYLIGILF